MTKASSARQVIAAIGCPFLRLYRGEGYWYFEYDDCAASFETRSVMTMRLNDMTVEQWVAEGRELVNKMEEK